MRHEGRTNHPHLYNATVKGVFGLIVKRYGGVTSHNAAYLRDIKGPAILSPVHRSMLDTPVASVAAIRDAGKQVHFGAKSDLWEIPLLGPYIELCGAFKIDRSEGLTPAVTRQVGKIAANHGTIGLFAEGGRQTGDKIDRKSVHRGPAILALLHGMPIVPAGIVGTEESNRGPIHMVFGAPILVEQQGIDLARPKTYIKPVGEITDQLHEAMQACQDRALELQAV